MTHVSETHTYVDLKFFSSVSEMTLRFDDKLDMLAARIPLQRQEPALVTHRQFVLITPTYGGGNGRGAVPQEGLQFLNVGRHRQPIRGVVRGGDPNLGRAERLA